MDHQDYKVVDIGNPKLKALRAKQNSGSNEIKSKSLKNNNSALQGTGCLLYTSPSPRD